MYCRNMDNYHTRHGYRLLEWHLFPRRMLKLWRKQPQVQFQDLFLKLFGQNPMEKRWGFNQYISFIKSAGVDNITWQTLPFILWIENTANQKAKNLLLILRYVTGSISPKNLGMQPRHFPAKIDFDIMTGKTFHSTNF